jgi:2'-5' RNA ligase
MSSLPFKDVISFYTMNALFFIALLPPEDIAEEATAFKELAAQRFRSRRALNSPPHITLQPPFRWPEERIGEIESLLADFAKAATPFQQELRDFDCFKPRVIFVNVVLNDALQDLAARLAAALRPLIGEDQIEKRPYHPHMTVAFKDLKPRYFYPAWEYFSRQKYERAFQADALYLLKHDGGKWVVKSAFPFPTIDLASLTRPA